jgi:O-antigen/teichoic acid export membrane protein
LHFVGFDFFEKITGKEIDSPKDVIFYAFLGVYLNSAAVYFQKRLEVHRRMKLLAYLSIFSALASMLFAWIGGMYYGLYGVSLGVLFAQIIYFVYVVISMRKRLDLYRSFGLPVITSIIAFSVGYLCYVCLQGDVIPLLWWERSLCWLAVFSAISVFSLWKGVKWGEFMKANL